MKDINNMDRKPIRKFKRLFKKNEEYDFTFKKQMDIINFKQKDFFLENMIDEKIIYDIKESNLTKQLISLESIILTEQLCPIIKVGMKNNININFLIYLSINFLLIIVWSELISRK